MSFKKYGGLKFAATNNIVKSHFSNSDNPQISNYLGQSNSKIVSASHIDMSDNSICNVQCIYFYDGTAICSGIPIDISASNWGDYLYWNSITSKWAIGDTNITLGKNAGKVLQGDSAVALGNNAGNFGQGSSAVAIGFNAGKSSQGPNAVAIGNGAGNSGQLETSIAIGYNAGEKTQKSGSIAIGYIAGNKNQEESSIAIGSEAGYDTQGSSSIAIGDSAGRDTQGSQSIAIGSSAGYENQLSNSIAIGYIAGNKNQEESSIAIGSEAGRENQGPNAIAIGTYACSNGQEEYSIAIGYLAGQYLPAKSIEINATGAYIAKTFGGPLNACYIAPIRDASGRSMLMYDGSTHEVTYGNTINGSITSTSSITAASFVTSSDYRIKENVELLDDTFSVDNLKPVHYTNIVTHKHDIGFLAHEVQKEFPYLVSGEKDGPETQALNYQGLIGVLVKEIQELKKRVLFLEEKT